MSLIAQITKASSAPLEVGADSYVMQLSSVF